MMLLDFFKNVLLSKYLAVTLQRKIFQQCRLRANKIGIVVTILGQGQNFPKMDIIYGQPLILGKLTH